MNRPNDEDRWSLHDEKKALMASETRKLEVWRTEIDQEIKERSAPAVNSDAAAGRRGDDALFARLRGSSAVLASSGAGGAS